MISTNQFKNGAHIEVEGAIYRIIEFQHVKPGKGGAFVRLSFVRTNAPPLPGLTCWKSTILKTVPSTSMCVPFLNWLVLITAAEGSGRPAS